MKKFNLGVLVRFLKIYSNRSTIQNNYFTNSFDYWIERNEGPRASGIGSYGKNATEKAKFINYIIRNLKINSVIDYGCGDGNQLKRYEVTNYTGIDVNLKQLNKLKERFPEKKFYHFSEKIFSYADLKMSIDVIYHLVEDYYFYDHMDKLFDGKSDYVLIFSTNFDSLGEFHVRHRNFKRIVANDYPNYVEVAINHPQKHIKFGSASFYLYQRFDGHN
jgi:SAM-dependent methyltransferase